MRVSKFTFHFCLNNCFYSRFKWFLDLKDFSLFTKFCTSMPLCSQMSMWVLYAVRCHLDILGLWFIVNFVKFCFPFSFTRESVRQVMGRAALIRTKCWCSLRLVERDSWGRRSTGMGWFSNYVKGSQKLPSREQKQTLNFIRKKWKERARMSAIELHRTHTHTHTRAHAHTHTHTFRTESL